MRLRTRPPPPPPPPAQPKLEPRSTRSTREPSTNPNPPPPTTRQARSIQLTTEAKNARLERMEKEFSDPRLRKLRTDRRMAQIDAWLGVFGFRVLGEKSSGGGGGSKKRAAAAAAAGEMDGGTNNENEIITIGQIESDLLLSHPTPQPPKPRSERLRLKKQRKIDEARRKKKGVNSLGGASEDEFYGDEDVLANLDEEDKEVDGMKENGGKGKGKAEEGEEEMMEMEGEESDSGSESEEEVEVTDNEEETQVEKQDNEGPSSSSLRQKNNERAKSVQSSDLSDVEDDDVDGKQKEKKKDDDNEFGKEKTDMSQIDVGTALNIDAPKEKEGEQEVAKDPISNNTSIDSSNPNSHDSKALVPFDPTTKKEEKKRKIIKRKKVRMGPAPLIHLPGLFVKLLVALTTDRQVNLTNWRPKLRRHYFRRVIWDTAYMNHLESLDRARWEVELEMKEEQEERKRKEAADEKKKARKGGNKGRARGKELELEEEEKQDGSNTMEGALVPFMAGNMLGAPGTSVDSASLDSPSRPSTPTPGSAAASGAGGRGGKSTRGKRGGKGGNRIQKLRKTASSMGAESPTTAEAVGAPPLPGTPLTSNLNSATAAAVAAALAVIPPGSTVVKSDENGKPLIVLDEERMIRIGWCPLGLDGMDGEKKREWGAIREWEELNVEEQIEVIYRLCEWQVTQNPEKFRYGVIKQGKDEDGSGWRNAPVAIDSVKNQYWHFPSNRLWVQRHIPAPPKKSNKRKKAEIESDAEEEVVNGDGAGAKGSQKRRGGGGAGRGKKRKVGMPKGGWPTKDPNEKKTPNLKKKKAMSPATSDEEDEDDRVPLFDQPPQLDFTGRSSRRKTGALEQMPTDFYNVRKTFKTQITNGGNARESASPERRSSRGSPSRRVSRVSNGMDEDGWQKVPKEWINGSGRKDEDETEDGEKFADAAFNKDGNKDTPARTESNQSSQSNGAPGRRPRGRPRKSFDESTPGRGRGGRGRGRARGNDSVTPGRSTRNTRASEGEELWQEVPKEWLLEEQKKAEAEAREENGVGGQESSSTSAHRHDDPSPLSKMDADPNATCQATEDKAQEIKDEDEDTAKEATTSQSQSSPREATSPVAPSIEPLTNEELSTSTPAEADPPAIETMNQSDVVAAPVGERPIAPLPRRSISRSPSPKKEGVLLDTLVQGGKIEEQIGEVEIKKVDGGGEDVEMKDSTATVLASAVIVNGVAPQPSVPNTAVGDSTKTELPLNPFEGPEFDKRVSDKIKPEERYVPEGFVEWECICVELDDWKDLAETFQNSKDKMEIAFRQYIVMDVIPEMEAELEEKEKQRKMVEQVNNRKRSSRIAMKESEREEAARQESLKQEEVDRNARALRAEKRREAEEARRIAEEEQKAQRMGREERARLREQAAEMRAAGADPAEIAAMQAKTKVATPVAEGSSRGLRSSKRKRTDHSYRETDSEEFEWEDEEEPEEKDDDDDDDYEEGFKSKRRRKASDADYNPEEDTEEEQPDTWYLNCCVCNKKGQDAGDGSEIVECDQCGDWHHVPCLEKADKNAGRGVRNYKDETEDFVCYRCQSSPRRKRGSPSNKARSASPSKTTPSKQPPRSILKKTPSTPYPSGSFSPATSGYYSAPQQHGAGGMPVWPSVLSQGSPTGQRPPYGGAPPQSLYGSPLGAYGPRFPVGNSYSGQQQYPASYYAQGQHHPLHHRASPSGSVPLHPQSQSHTQPTSMFAQFLTAARYQPQILNNMPHVLSQQFRPHIDTMRDQPIDPEVGKAAVNYVMQQLQRANQQQHHRQQQHPSPQQQQPSQALSPQQQQSQQSATQSPAPPNPNGSQFHPPGNPAAPANHHHFSGAASPSPSTSSANNNDNPFASTSSTPFSQSLLSSTLSNLTNLSSAGVSQPPGGTFGNTAPALSSGASALFGQQGGSPSPQHHPAIPNSMQGPIPPRLSNTAPTALAALLNPTNTNPSHSPPSQNPNPNPNNPFGNLNPAALAHIFANQQRQQHQQQMGLPTAIAQAFPHLAAITNQSSPSAPSGSGGLPEAPGGPGVFGMGMGMGQIPGIASQSQPQHQAPSVSPFAGLSYNNLGSMAQQPPTPSPSPNRSGSVATSTFQTANLGIPQPQPPPPLQTTPVPTPTPAAGSETLSNTGGEVPLAAPAPSAPSTGVIPPLMAGVNNPPTQPPNPPGVTEGRSEPGTRAGDEAGGEKTEVASSS